MSLLPVEPAYRLAERSQEHHWLVSGLWSEQAVGIVGGERQSAVSRSWRWTWRGGIGVGAGITRRGWR